MKIKYKKHSRLKKMMIGLVLMICVFLCVGTTAFSMWMIDWYGMSQIGTKNYIETKTFVSNLNVRLEGICQSIDTLDAYKQYQNYKTNTKMLTVIAYKDGTNKQYTFENLKKISKIKYCIDTSTDMKSVADDYSEDYFDTSTALDIKVDDVRDIQQCVEISYDDYLEIIKSVAIPNNVYIQEFHKNLEDEENQAEGDPTTEMVIADQEEFAVEPELINADFSEDCHIYENGSFTFVYDPINESFYNSEQGWYTPPSRKLYFDASKVMEDNEYIPEFFLENDFYQLDTIATIKTAYPLVYQTALDNIKSQNSNINYCISCDAGHYTNGKTFEEIKGMDTSFVYEASNQSLVTGLYGNEDIVEMLSKMVNDHSLGSHAVIAIGVNQDYAVSDMFSDGNYYYEHYYRFLILAIVVAIATGILSIILALYSVFITGHKTSNPEEAIQLNGFDRIPIELAIVITIIVTGIIIALFYGTAYYSYYGKIYRISLGIVWSIVAYLVVINAFYSLVRRVKAHTLYKNSICFYAIRFAKKGIRTFFQNRKIARRTVALYAVWTIVNSVIVMITIILLYNGTALFILCVLIWIAIQVFITYLLVKRTRGIRDLYEGTRRIAEGDIHYQISKDNLLGALIDIGDNINHMGDGLQKAIEQSIKDERLKAELITNVSHDIKTPLTSIINYVDLIKRENIQDENIRKYITILDQKSQRLKQLTEDLVEASKVSTGNITLECLPLDFSELLKQALGEFEDKFTSKQLTIVEKYTEEPTIIFADGRRTFRILDNLFQNISKYALPNTRVYIDLSKEKGIVHLSIKNISAAPLNISVDELTERFTRGDQARTTEGSGLGLSIAKDLVKLQNGELKICLDGDLFKIVIAFPKFKKDIAEEMPAEEIPLSE